MTRHLGSSQVPNIVGVKVRFPGINKMVDELYERPFIPAPVVPKFVLKVYIKKI